MKHKLVINWTKLAFVVLTLIGLIFPSLLFPTTSSLSAEVLAQSDNKRKAKADSLFNQGAKQFENEQFTQALKYWEEALNIYREIKDRQSEANVLGFLGMTYLSQRQYQKTIEYAQQHLAIAREIKDKPGEAIALFNLASAYKSLGQTQKAFGYWVRYFTVLF